MNWNDFSRLRARRPTSARESDRAARRGSIAAAVQRLAGLDVPDAGEQALVHDRDLDRQARALEPRVQLADVDAVDQRIGAERAELGEVVEARAGDEAEAAEHPQVGVVEARAVVEVDLEAREAGWGRAGAAEQPLAGHPEVRPDADRPRARRERDEQVLADAPDVLDARAGQSAASARADAGRRMRAAPAPARTPRTRRPLAHRRRLRAATSTSGSSGIGHLLPKGPCNTQYIL